MRKMGSVPILDETHDPDLKSWVESANAPGCDFPVQNLPFGIFRCKNSKEARRAGVAIGDQIFDLAALGVKSGPTLNGLAAMGRPAWKKLRKEISKALVKGKKSFEKHLVPMKRAELFLPVTVGDYTDFYTSVFHATNVGRLFRPDNPLLPNYKWLPIGPFLAKSFGTTISPWVVTLEGLAPFRCPAFARPAGDPQPLPYLFDEADSRAGGFSIEVEMYLRTPRSPAPVRLSHGNYNSSYWTPAQLIAHHSSNGCNLQPGDLVGSGTISGPTPDSAGSLLELTQGGKAPLELPSGEARTFIEDGDEVIERARCAREGYAMIGFGEAAGKVVASK